jgi:hypothetical protein
VDSQGNLTKPESDQLRVLTALLPPEYAHAHYDAGMTSKEAYGLVSEGVALIRCGWLLRCCIRRWGKGSNGVY